MLVNSLDAHSEPYPYRLAKTLTPAIATVLCWLTCNIDHRMEGYYYTVAEVLSSIVLEWSVRVPYIERNRSVTWPVLLCPSPTVR